MKRRNYIVIALMAMGAIAISCSEAEQIEQTVTVSINPEIPAESRTIGDGGNIDKVVCAVYYNGQELTHLRETLPVTGGVVQGTYTPEVIKDRTYTFVFWAHTDGAYNVTTLENITRTAGYAGASCDAFTNKDTKYITSSVDLGITLSRPFAQLNIGVTEADWNAVQGFNYTPDKVTIAVESYAAYNAVAGAVAGSATEQSFTNSPLPTGTLTAVNGNSYNYMFADFILVGSDSQTTDIDCTIYDGAEAIRTLTMTAVPVKPNYKTNVVGTIMTGTVQYSIDFEDNFKFEDEVDKDLDQTNP